MEWIENEGQIKSLENIRYFEGNEIKSNVIGTIAGMLLTYGDDQEKMEGEKKQWQKPMMAFTEMGDEKDGLKVSLRCSRLLAYDGIHFGNLIKKVADKVGGTGGGHSVACGAYIPTEKKEDFLKIFNNSINGLI